MSLYYCCFLCSRPFVGCFHFQFLLTWTYNQMLFSDFGTSLHMNWKLMETSRHFTFRNDILSCIYLFVLFFFTGETRKFGLKNTIHRKHKLVTIQKSRWSFHLCCCQFVCCKFSIHIWNPQNRRLFRIKKQVLIESLSNEKKSHSKLVFLCSGSKL